jgi:hypothetical protein
MDSIEIIPSGLIVVEEVLKIGVVKTFPSLGFTTLRCSIFFVVEAISKFGSLSEVYFQLSHSQMYAISMAIIISIVSSILHVYTSLLYAFTSKILISFVLSCFCLLAFNSSLIYSKYFGIDFYPIFLTGITSVLGLILFAYFQIEKRLLKFDL